MKVIQVGVYPPPFGGVSVHIKRLFDRLAKEDQETLLIDLSRVPKDQPGLVQMRWIRAVVFLLFCAPASIVHFHNFSTRNTFFFFLISFRHRTILSFHNERFLSELNSHGWFCKALAVQFLRKLDVVVVDSRHCRELAAAIIHEPTRLVTIPEFIPSATNLQFEDDKVTSLRKSCKYLLSSYAFQIAFHQGQDLYGLDLLVELVDRLVHHLHLDVGMVFLLPNIGDAGYFQEITRRVKLNGLSDRFYFLTKPVPETATASIWRISDVVIRASNTDGNSLTVMEALTLKVPVVASDCVVRPEGTVLFQSRNVDDLCEKVAEVLENLDVHRSRLEQVHLGDHARAFLNLYKTFEQTPNVTSPGGEPGRKAG